MDSEVLVGLAAAPVIAALLQVVKPYLTDPRSWPIVSIVLGVAWNLAANIETGVFGWATCVLVGVVAGLAACGFYSGVKTYNPSA